MNSGLLENFNNVPVHIIYIILATVPNPLERQCEYRNLNAVEIA